MNKLAFITNYFLGRNGNAITWVRFLIIFALIMVWGVFFYHGISERNQLIKEEVEQVKKVARIAAEQTGGMIRDIKRVLVAMDYLIDEKGLDPRFDKGFLRFVNNYRNSYKITVDFRLVSSDGGLFYIPATSYKPLADVHDREYFKVQRNEKTRGFYIAEPVKSRVTNLWVIPISYPLKNSGSGISVLYTAIENPEMIRMLQLLRINRDDTVSLIRQDGKILSMVPFDENKINASVLEEQFWKKYRLNNKTSGSLISKIELYHTKKSIIAYQKVDDLPMIVAVSVSYDSFLSEWERGFVIRTVILIIVSVIMILMGIKIVHLMSRLDTAHRELLAVNDDLTVQVDAVKNELIEKEIIVREVYHRVKNQMAQLIQMIDLSGMSKTDSFYAVLMARVQSYAILYDMLTYTKNVSMEINLSLYINEVAARILEIYSGKNKIRCNVECPSVNINIKKGTIIAMILNELMTNSIKYAFVSKSEPLIEISVKEKDSIVSFRYHDNGSGFDYSDISKKESRNHLGFILVNTFIRQYKGSLSYSGDGGSTFDIVI
jgi:two-component sensor histidine kinase